MKPADFIDAVVVKLKALGKLILNGLEFIGTDFTVRIRRESITMIQEGQETYRIAADNSVNGILFPALTIVIHGDVKTMRSLVGSVSVNGQVGSVESVGGDVYCHAVTGNVESAQGDITCGDVAGDVRTAQGDISCVSVKGSVTTQMGDINIKGGKT